MPSHPTLDRSSAPASPGAPHPSRCRRGHRRPLVPLLGLLAALGFVVPTPGFGAAPMGIGPAAAAAQAPEASGTLRGVVRDAESGAPLQAAQVSALDPESGDRLGAVLTDGDGGFLLRGIPAGGVTLAVVYVGYAPVDDLGAEVEADQVVDVGDILLRVQAIQLEGVGVESRRSAVSFEADRTVYRIDGMPTVGGGSLSDALGSVPELDVDFEGRVEFEGNAPEIYLNGRPAPVDGEALTVFLEQFPADRIERIEVIPNPSARYDAEGAGGIVNIVLAEDVELGLTGSLFANAGTRGDAGSGGRVSWQRGDLTVQGGGFLRHTDRETASSSLRENRLADPTTFLEQDRLSRQGGLTGGVDLTTEYGLTERTLVWARTRINDLGSDTDGETLSLRRDAEGLPLEATRRLSSTDRDQASFDVEGGVQVTFGASDVEHAFSAEVRRDARRTTTFREFETEFLDAGDLPPLARLDETLEDRSRVRVQLDYVRPVGATQLEVGLRGQYRDNERVQASGAVASRGFVHRERFHSAFATASRSAGPLGVQVGVRVEDAEVTLRFPGTEATTEATAEPGAVAQRYLRVFPSANVSWRFDGARQLRLSYGQRIRRPFPSRLDPFDRSDDPLLRQVGNPDLAPQTTHNLRLDASWRGSVGTLRLTPFYRYTTDEWAEIRTVDAEGIATERWENVATTHQVGSSLSLSARDLRGWGGSLRVSGRQEFRSDDALALEARGGTALRWSVRGDVNRAIGRSITAQVRVNYSPAREIPQGFVSSSLMTQVGFRARFLDRRASVNLSLRDPFNLHDQTFESRDPTHVELRSTVPDRRSAVVSFSYALGSSGRR